MTALLRVAPSLHAPVRSKIARFVFEQAVSRVPVRASYPDGRTVGAGGRGAPVFQVVHPAAFFARLARDAKVGFGESYMAGDWRAADGCDLADLLTPFAARLTGLLPKTLQRLRVLIDRRIPRSQDNTLNGSRANISAHYDLSNELFAAFLDRTMSYSSALFDEADPIDDAATLEAAQLRKIEAILDLADVTTGTSLLEIGSGWGSLAIQAAKRGATVTTITLSKEQKALADERIADAGVADRVDVRVQDYREVRGTFDAIVSVEMIEAVGEAYWPVYFRSLDRLLAPGGKVAIQAITMSHERYLATRNSFGWVQKYIFPGGLIPSTRAIDDILQSYTSLRVSHRRDMGEHYARTLRLWRERFISEWPNIRALGFDETFRRMWELYLAYSEAGFRSGYLGVTQVQLTRSST